MPTQKRRINVTVGDAEYELVHRLAERGQVSMGSVVRELIDAARPTLERMVQAMDAFADADADKQRQMLAHLEAAHADLLPDAAAVIERSDRVWEFGADEK